MKHTNSIIDVSGIQVGHETNESALTGCTVILCPDGAVGGADQRGGAPGTRETDLLRPMHMVEKVHAVLLAGGSAFGLDAASGVMRYLEENEIGFNVGVARVPIVPAAVLFDLGIGDQTSGQMLLWDSAPAKTPVPSRLPKATSGPGAAARSAKSWGQDSP